MRDFAFVDCGCLQDSIKIVEYSQKHAFKVYGKEISVAYSKV